MAIRFRKSIKIAPGVRLNIGKKSGSVRIGGKNAGYTIGSKGNTASASLAGTGLGVSKRHGGGGLFRVLVLAGLILVAVAIALALWPHSPGV